MDNQKNIIAAISLSAAVIVLYSLFFMEPVPDQRKLENKNKENTKLTSNAEAPKIDEVEEIKQISRGKWTKKTKSKSFTALYNR